MKMLIFQAALLLLLALVIVYRLATDNGYATLPAPVVINELTDDSNVQPPQPFMLELLERANAPRPEDADSLPSDINCTATQHIIHISRYLYNRTPFTYRELETADWIVAELLSMGFAPEDIYIQEFCWYDFEVLYWHHNYGDFFLDTFFTEDVAALKQQWGSDNLRADLRSQNIILTIPGQSEKTIIIGAHYDSVLNEGAQDNASGVALLLKSARQKMAQENYHTLKYIFFGAEEIGLRGSQFFVDSMTDQQRENLVFMINADMLIGKAPRLNAAVLQDGAAGENEITKQIAELNNQLDELDILFTNRNVFATSDHLPFFMEEFTIVFLIAHCAEVRELWHTPYDNWDYINRTYPGLTEANMQKFSVLLESMLFNRWRV